MKTKTECQTILFNLGVEYGVSPRLISTRLLNDEDKHDMMDGSLSIASLRASIESWKASGMPDYAKGRIETWDEDKKMEKFERTTISEKPGITYIKPFVEWRIVD